MAIPETLTINGKQFKGTKATNTVQLLLTTGPKATSVQDDFDTLNQFKHLDAPEGTVAISLQAVLTILSKLETVTEAA